jgi:hypothetical protein
MSQVEGFKAAFCAALQGGAARRSSKAGCISGLISCINETEFVKNFTIFLAKVRAHSVHPVLDGARGWRTKTAGGAAGGPEKTVDGPQSLGKNTRSLMPEFGSGSDVPKQSRFGA